MLLCGNRAAPWSCEHIAGTFKGFKLDGKFQGINQIKRLRRYLRQTANGLACQPCLNASIMTAVINDISGDMVFAQQVSPLPKGDVLVAIALQAIHSRFITPRWSQSSAASLALTGDSGGKLKAVADILINVPDSETYRCSIYSSCISLYMRAC